MKNDLLGNHECSVASLRNFLITIDLALTDDSPSEVSEEQLKELHIKLRDE